MNNKVDMLIDAFVTGDYFIIFLVIILIILLVLVLALIKTREDYNELLNSEEKKNDIIVNNTIEDEEDDLLDDLRQLMSSNSDDVIDENKPLIKQVNLDNIDSLKENVTSLEALDEENAVISAEELEKRTKERLDNLGSNENQEAILKYEEEQEKKAIISYEQLLKNASNITLSYKEEKPKEKNAPRVNKIELEQKEVSGPEIYLAEEEFLKILKEFRISLE